MKFSPLLEDLINALKELPGIGPRSAQRIAMSMMKGDRAIAKNLSRAIDSATKNLKFCTCCHNYSEKDVCDICGSVKRQAKGVICVVENPADVLAIEQTNEYGGIYFVLHGKLSPLDGIGPKELKLDELEKLLKSGDYSEIILATSPTVEGDATAHYIGHLAKHANVKATRIARGIPIGSDIDNVDGSTLMRSLNGRMPL